MHKKTRQYVRRAEGREGVSVRLGGGDDLPAFAELMRATARREGFADRGLEYYQAEWETFSPGDQCALLLAYHEGRLIAARTVCRCGQHAAEFNGGSVPTPGRHANHLLVWRAIEWARGRGCRTYDLWGVPDEVEPGDGGAPPSAPDRSDGLWGVYRFKRGFGAALVRYAGAYDVVLRRRLYSLTSAALVNRQLWERAAATLDRAARKGTSTGVTS
jgi:lipid II:glycine glycyltransferase (peptidoglycan interpeptide bridge formation enzyme)